VGPGVGPTSGELDEVRAFLSLKEVAGLGDRGIRRLVDEFGSGAEALKAVRRGGWPRIRKTQGTSGRRPARGKDSGGPSARPWNPADFRIIPMTSPSYPSILTDLTDPPPLLFLDGREELLHRPAVAVVGARKATELGRRVAGSLGRALGRAGVTVVSGLALGIDGAAHAGALDVGGDTVGVLGSGIQVVYPPSHRSLFRDIRRRGLLVSEFLPHETPLPHHFPRRNRIIAALVRAVVVVEAGRKSGALITVDHALDLGRDVLAVPGSVESPLAVGTNGLLRDGARALPDPESVLKELEEIFPDLPRGEDAVGATSRREDSVPPELRTLLGTLALEPRSVDEVASASALSSGEALAGLLALELGGWALQCPGMRFQRRQEGR